MLITLGMALEETLKIDPTATITYNDITITAAEWMADDTEEGLAAIMRVNSRLTEPNGNYRVVNMEFTDTYGDPFIIRYLNPHMEVSA